MGEIGIPRREFLYEIQFWEARRIINGYNARYHQGWEQARLIAYHVRYCMGLSKGEVAKTLLEWLKFAWEKDEPAAPLSEEDRADLRAAMDAENKRLKQAQQSEQ